MNEDAAALLETLHRDRYRDVVVALTREFGLHRLEMVEEVIQEASARALIHWVESGIPRNPGGWWFVAARRLLIDRLRGHAERVESLADDHADVHELPATSIDPLEDDVLRMTFVCCHPELPRKAQIAMVLKNLCGLGDTEIGRVLFMHAGAVKKTLTRARARIRERRITFDLPETAHVSQRLDALMQCIYAIFSEGYLTHGGDRDILEGLCHQSLTLIETLLRARGVSELGRLHALAALMHLQASRLPTRLDADGDIVRLADQDRQLWDTRSIERGMQHLERSMESGERTVYHLQAGIAACHAIAPSWEATDWRQIRGWYDDLLDLAPSAAVSVNRAVAVAMVAGFDAGLHALLQVEAEGEDYWLLPAVKADFLREVGRDEEAAAEYRRALTQVHGSAMRSFLEARLDACAPEY